MNIGKRLTLGIIGIIILAAGANILGIVSLQRARQSVSMIYHNATEPIAIANDLTQTFMGIRVGLYQIAGTEDTVSIPVIEKKMADQRVIFHQQLAKLKPMLSDKVGTDLLNEIESNIIEYEFSVDSMIDMVNTGNMPAAEMKVKFELALLGDSINELITQVAQNQVKFAALLYDKTDQSVNTNTVFMIMVTLIVLIVSLTFGLLMARAISRPLMVTTKFSQMIANGDLTVIIDPKYVQRRDEIGLLSQSMAVMVEKLRTNIEAVASVENQVRQASSQLDARVELEVDEVHNIGQHVSEIGQVILNLSASVNESAAIVREIVSNLKKLDSLIENQSTNVTESSASIEQMIGNTNSIANNVQLMSSAFVALETASAAGQERINETVTIIQMVAEQSEKLQEANLIINSIAAQTNLLAMNASIESAHAGDAGKGFAVVADEIRNLASKAANQSKEISLDIQNIRNSIQQVTDASSQTEVAFNGITQQISILGHYESEIKRAMDEQKAGSQQILEATMQINTITENVREASAQMLGGSHMIVSEMDSLNRMSQSVSTRMDAIAVGSDSIKSSVNEIKEISQHATVLALQLSDQIGRFKL